MADPNVLGLQQVLNRYAAVANFASLAIDGDIGPKTYDAVQRALSYVGGTAVYKPQMALSAEVMQQAKYLSQTMKTQQQVAANASTIGTFLASAANTLGLATVAVTGDTVFDFLKNLFVKPTAPAPVPSVPTGTMPTAPAPLPATLTTGISQTWAAVPTWGRIGIGAAVGLGLIFGVSAIRKRKSLPAG